jgi:formiminotetrahydrofolate cyclodeaminase
VSRSFLEQLSQPRPDPGGGAASAHAAAIGVALLEKVVGLEILRKDNTQQEHWHGEAAEVRRLASALADIQEKDTLAYLRLAHAKSVECAREELQAAIEEAVACPSEIMEIAARVLDCVSRVGRACKGHLIPDLQVACELMGAAIKGSYYIAAANLPLFANETEIGRQRLRLSTRLDAILGQLHIIRQDLVLRTRVRSGRHEQT